MSVVSYNVYDADTDQKLNEQPIPIDQDWDWTGRASGTPYRIYTRTIDQAGNISDPGPVTEETTEQFTPDSEMDPADKAVIDQIFTDAMAAGAGPGLIWYISGPKGTYIGARGSAGKRPITVDDHFRIGSATKPFVAVAVLRCVDQGLLSLEDTIDQFDTDQYKLSDIPNASKIKVRHLLMMRSGVFDEQKDLGMLLRLVLFPTMEFNEQAHFNIAKGNPPMFEVGTDFHYTNANYVLLGLIVQAVTGRNIRNVVIEDMFEPLGLTETSWPNTSEMPAPYATGHGGGAGGDPTVIHPSYAYAAGCIVSTIHDLHKWVEALRDRVLLSPETHAVWMSTFCPIGMQPDFGAPPQVGYGLGMYDFGEWKGHAGSWPGYECSPTWHPESGAIVCIAENSQTTGTDKMTVSTFSRMFPQIAEFMLPGSMAAKEYTSCSVAADPRAFPMAPASLGYGGVSEALAGSGAVSKPFTAAAGADVFAFVNWDRQGSIPVVKYGGVDMTRIAVAYHNNDAQYGGQALYRLAGAGTGVSKTLAVSGASTWITGFGVSFGPVSGVSSPSVNFGMGTVHSHSVAAQPSSITLQAFSGAYGSSQLGTVSGGRNRARFVGVSPQLVVNTAFQTGVVSALSPTANRWSSIAVDIQIAQDVDLKPLPRVLPVTGGQPQVLIDVANKVLAPSPAALHVSGGRPGGEALTPAGAVVSVTGGQPAIEVKAAFEPFTEENVNRTNAPVPVGTTGAWVRLGGAGGGGGSGRRSNSGYRYGGGGGGGGAYIDVWVPVELMGSTYSVTLGTGGAGGAKAYSGDGRDGADGGASTFTSGGVSLTANGGQGGKKGTSSSSSGARGLGGTAVITGITATGFSGGNGGNGGSSPTNGQSRTNGAGRGGGGGGGKLSNDNTISGGSAGTSDGPAGKGGSGSSGGSGDGFNGGTGTDGYNRIEWSNLPNGGA
ncbi:minor tail protein [Mycobacterium phage ThetaBob]|nr:minor tail protein [Mycobacterium phage ThetaBob]QDF19908.1 minor tail protein [Mycobacterium phage ThetaBob]